MIKFLNLLHCKVLIGIFYSFLFLYRSDNLKSISTNLIRYSYFIFAFFVLLSNNFKFEYIFLLYFIVFLISGLSFDRKFYNCTISVFFIFIYKILNLKEIKDHSIFNNSLYSYPDIEIFIKFLYFLFLFKDYIFNFTYLEKTKSRNEEFFFFINVLIYKFISFFYFNHNIHFIPFYLLSFLKLYFLLFSIKNKSISFGLYSIQIAGILSNNIDILKSDLFISFSFLSFLCEYSIIKCKKFKFNFIDWINFILYFLFFILIFNKFSINKFLHSFYKFDYLTYFALILISLYYSFKNIKFFIAIKLKFKNEKFIYIILKLFILFASVFFIYDFIFKFMYYKDFDILYLSKYKMLDLIFVLLLIFHKRSRKIKILNIFQNLSIFSSRLFNIFSFVLTYFYFISIEYIIMFKIKIMKFLRDNFNSLYQIKFSNPSTNFLFIIITLCFILILIFSTNYNILK